jgi:hypothetical protein
MPVGGTFVLEISFDEPVTGLGYDDFLITNGHIEAGSLVEVNPSLYRLQIIPEATGYVIIDMDENAVRDEDMNGNTPAETLVVEADLDSPRVVLFTNVAEPVRGTFTIYVTFGEPVEGLHEGDLRVNNGFVSGGSLDTDNNLIFSVDIIPAGCGDIVVHLPADAANDEDGYGNLASKPLRVEAELPEALEEESGNKQFRCYPNPTNGNFYIEVPENTLGTWLIIYNSAGSEVYRSRIENTTNHLCPEHLDKGIYFIQIGNEDTFISQKLLLQ